MSKVSIERAHRMDGTGEYYFSRRLREIAEIEATTGRQIIKLATHSQLNNLTTSSRLNLCNLTQTT